MSLWARHVFLEKTKTRTLIDDKMRENWLRWCGHVKKWQIDTIAIRVESVSNRQEQKKTVINIVKINFINLNIANKNVRIKILPRNEKVHCFKA